MMAGNNLNELDAFHDDEELNVVIETPKGSRNKYNYDEKLRLFKLVGVLTSGAVFPFDFGFVPSTTGGDGDPLDVLVLMDEPAFAGSSISTSTSSGSPSPPVVEGTNPKSKGKTAPEVSTPTSLKSRSFSS